jgi:hypothetical protein
VAVGRPNSRFSDLEFPRISPLLTLWGYPFVEMTFRTKKFEKQSLIFIVLGAVMLAPEFYINIHHLFTAEVAFQVAPWIIIILSWVVPPLFGRLELDSDCLRYRYSFKTTEVPFSEVTVVRNYGITIGDLVIEFSPPFSKADPKSIVVNPKDRSGFISAMRQFAPQATFE